MERIEINIQIGSEIEEFNIKNETIKQQEAVAIYIDHSLRVWAVTPQVAEEILESYQNNSKSEMIGKSEYILIYDAREVIQIDGSSYIVGESLIMKASKQVEGIPQNEIHTVIQEYGTRLQEIVIGGIRVYGYELT